MKLLGPITKLVVLILGVTGTYLLSPLASGQNSHKPESSDPYFRPNANGSELPRMNQPNSDAERDGWIRNDSLFNPDYARSPKQNTIIRQGEPKLQSTQAWQGPEIVKNENVSPEYANARAPAKFGQLPAPQVAAAAKGTIRSTPVQTPWGYNNSQLAQRAPRNPQNVQNSTPQIVREYVNQPAARNAQNTFGSQPETLLASKGDSPDANFRTQPEQVAVKKAKPVTGINDVVRIKSPNRSSSNKSSTDNYFGDMQLAKVKNGPSSVPQPRVSDQGNFVPNSTNFSTNAHTTQLAQQSLPQNKAIQFERQKNRFLDGPMTKPSLGTHQIANSQPSDAPRIEAPVGSQNDFQNNFNSNKRLAPAENSSSEPFVLDDAFVSTNGPAEPKNNEFANPLVSAKSPNNGAGGFQTGPMFDSTLEASSHQPKTHRAPEVSTPTRNFTVSDESDNGNSFQVSSANGSGKRQFQVSPQTRSKSPASNAAAIAPTMSSNETPNTHQFASPTATTKPATSGQRQVEAASYQSFEPGRVLALVGGDPIFVGDLLFEANSIIEKYAPTAPTSVKRKQRPAIIKKILPRFIDSKLLYVSTMRGLPEQVDPEQVLTQADEEFNEKALPKLMEKAGVNSPVEFDAYLRTMGSSLRNMRRSWSKDQLVRFFLSRQLQVDTEVTHQEMLDYYYAHEADYEVPERSKWEQVMIRFDRSTSRAEAQKTIVELGNKIVYGAKLSAVAKDHSQGFMASGGGQHDWTSRDSLVLKEIDEAIFELPIGELSDIIETRDGLHIVRVVDRNESTRKSFLDAQVDIKKTIEDEKRDNAFKEHIKKLKDEIPVEIFDFSGDDENIGQTYTLQK